MVWSKQEFEREVRRQIVELAALRKRVPAVKEVLDRIDRMEDSHRGLLRKLTELFDGASPPAPAAGEGAAASMEPEKTFAAAIEACASSPAHLAAAPSLKHVTPGNLALAIEEAQGTYPDLNETCAACGKLVLSSILAGGEVVYQDSAWYHASCAKGGESFSKRVTLN
jgi:hypothetical protein